MSYLTAETKAELIAIAQEHYDADSITEGIYGEFYKGKFKGCLVGCTNHGLAQARGVKVAFNDHEATARLTGVPEWVWYMADYLFENVEEDRREFVRDFPKHLPAETDFQPVLHNFLVWVLTDAQYGSIQYADDAGRAATERVVALHRQAAEGDNPTQEEWDAAGAAGAAGDAAWAAGAARAAAGAAWDAAGAAWAAAGAAVAKAQRDEFVRLLEGAAR